MMHYEYCLAGKFVFLTIIILMCRLRKKFMPLLKIWKNVFFLNVLKNNLRIGFSIVCCSYKKGFSLLL